MYVCQICGYRTEHLEDYTEHLDYHISDENYAPDDVKWLKHERELMELEQDLKRILSKKDKPSGEFQSD